LYYKPTNLFPNTIRDDEAVVSTDERASGQVVQATYSPTFPAHVWAVQLEFNAERVLHDSVETGRVALAPDAIPTIRGKEKGLSKQRYL
jgi:hypothetical protein